MSYQVTTTWERDPEGRVLVETRTGDAPYRRTEYRWDGPLLGRIDVDLDGDGAPDQVTTHTYGPDGRLIQEVVEEDDATWTPNTRTYTWLAPAPSLDHVRTADYGSDGVVDEEREQRYDAAGHLVEARSWFAVLGLSETGRYEYDATGAEVFLDAAATWDDGRVRLSQRTTTRDVAGRPLEVGMWISDDGEVRQSWETWSWYCPDPAR